MHDYLKLLKALPDAPPLLGRDKFVKAAVLIPFVELDGQPHLLFQKRAHTIRQGREICFPGGLYDDAVDESFADTARRETLEELAVSPDKLEVGGCIGTFVSPTGIAIECFVGKLNIRSLDELNPPPEETESVFTLSIDALQRIPVEAYRLRSEFHSTMVNADGETVTLLPSRELGLPERYYHRWGGNHYRVLVYRTDYGTIWGITGEILSELLGMLKDNRI